MLSRASFALVIRARAAGAALAVCAALGFVAVSSTVQAQGSAAGTAAPAATPAVAAAPDLRRGRLLYIRCRACHELKQGEPNKIGPNLNGFLTRKSGTVAEFVYSAPFKAANLTWDRPTLERWLENPSDVVPGNSMAFAGISSAADRAVLIAYLEAESK